MGKSFSSEITPRMDKKSFPQAAEDELDRIYAKEVATTIESRLEIMERLTEGPYEHLEKLSPESRLNRYEYVYLSNEGFLNKDLP